MTTIDRFFQRMLKAFTRELGIFPGYNVELDNEFVLLQAPDVAIAEASVGAVLSTILYIIALRKVYGRKGEQQ